MKRLIAIAAALALGVTMAAQQPAAKGTSTLTIYVDGVNNDAGNIGVLVFNNDKGWPEERQAALLDIVETAHPGTVVVKVPNLAPGTYAVALVHDVNKNHKVDKNFIGMPKEQWGMSNNPHATVKAPSFSKATFVVKADTEIHVQMQ